VKTLLLIVLTTLTLSLSCTDAGRGKITAYGNPAQIKCWSGGKLVFDRKSTGKVLSEAQSDGYFFEDAEDGKFKEVSGTCVITYDP